MLAATRADGATAGGACASRTLAGMLLHDMLVQVGIWPWAVTFLLSVLAIAIIDRKRGDGDPGGLILGGAVVALLDRFVNAHGWDHAIWWCCAVVTCSVAWYAFLDLLGPDAE